ncbi:hypothetical protein ACPCYV_32070 [Streptomyces mordarskii]|uniref:hypothetical protein n=1 Tax=Streptomyces TaxID=1883 RepID=UPI001B32A940|nr:hypothetical protein [Streptomyces sp. AgN23]QTI89921.1 hypothetical protein AS97_56650 [Streptomyces sp. AgN23]
MGDLLTIAGLPPTSSLPPTGDQRPATSDADRRPATGVQRSAMTTGDLLTTGDRPLVILFQNPGPEVSHFETPVTYTVEGL